MIICGSLYITVGNSGRVYAILISRFSCILPMECILIKVIIEDENFTGSKITTKIHEIYVPQKLLHGQLYS